MIKSRSIEKLCEKAITDCRFNYRAEKPAKREFIISILEGQSFEHEVGLISKSGILEVIGKKGSRKTAFMSMIVAAALSEKSRYGNIKVNIGDGSILWFDTEMSGDDFWYFQKTLHNMCGLNDNSDRLISINMDLFEGASEKLSVFINIMKNINNGVETDFFNGVSLIVLDGIADLISDTGNEKECREMLDSLKHVLNKTGCGLITVLHSDKKGQHSRGVLGTLLDQKTTSGVMLDMKMPGEPTIVRPDKVRTGRPFRTYKLEHDIDGTLLVDGQRADEMEQTLPVGDDFMDDSVVESKIF